MEKSLNDAPEDKNAASEAAEPTPSREETPWLDFQYFW